MQITPWFERIFIPIDDNGLFLQILERLEGTPARLSEKIKKIRVESEDSSSTHWSSKKQIGHLIDLEPIWKERVLQIIKGESKLLHADLTNRKTHETDHDSRKYKDLVKEFKELRAELIKILRNVDDKDLEKSALHPRLNKSMRIIDLAYFVAEHDDHHLVQIIRSGNSKSSRTSNAYS